MLARHPCGHGARTLRCRSATLTTLFIFMLGSCLDGVESHTQRPGVGWCREGRARELTAETSQGLRRRMRVRCEVWTRFGREPRGASDRAVARALVCTYTA